MNRRSLIQSAIALVLAPFGKIRKPNPQMLVRTCYRNERGERCTDYGLAEQDAWAESLHDDWILSEADEAAIMATKPVPFTGGTNVRARIRR